MSNSLQGSLNPRGNLTGYISGVRGPAGYYFIPSVSDEGIISWTNNGGLPNPEPKNIMGPPGKDGEKGEPGDSGVYIGDEEPTNDANVWIDTDGESEFNPDDYQKKLIAGDNIIIEDNVISSTGGGGGTTNYNLLTNKPKINNVELSGNKSLNDLGIINFSGDYDDLDNKPSIPTKTSDLTNDSGFIDDTYHDSTKQNTLVSGTNIKTINSQSILGSGNISIQGGSGTPDNVTTRLNSDSELETIGIYTTQDSARKIWEGTKAQYDAIITKDANTYYYITDDGVISYNDLANKPNIPTKTSDLSNDSGFITKSVNDLDNYTLTSNLAEVATSGDYEDLSNQPTIPTVVNNVTSVDTNNALSAYQGKLLSDRINNVESRGRFLALWNASTGLPTTEPPTLPYVYKTGDWFRVVNTGNTNYMPNGTQYTGVASTTTYSGSISAGDCFWYDGTSWQLEVNHAETAIEDVQVNGTSIVSANTANILTNSAYSSSNKIATMNDLPTVPTNVSSFTNDAGYLTSHQDISGKEDKTKVTIGSTTYELRLGNVGASGYITIEVES